MSRHVPTWMFRRTAHWLLPVAALAVTAGCAPGETAARSDEGLAAGEYSLWSDSAVPANPNDSDTAAVEIGTRFRVDTDGTVTAVRFYKSSQNTGRHTGSLWSAGGTRLATVSFTNETGSGWQIARFAAPVNVRAGRSYVVSYHTDVGHYAGDTGYFAGRGIDRGPLHAPAHSASAPNGVYRYGASGFPSQNWMAANYWVDVVYRPGGSTGTDAGSGTDAGTATDAGSSTATDAGGGATSDAGTATDAGGGSAGGSGLVFGGLFPIGVWTQPDWLFQTWKSRGVNTVTGVPSGWNSATWSAAARAAGMFYIRAPLSDPRADIGDRSLLAWSQPDEPDGIYSQVPYTQIQNSYDTWKSIDPSRQVTINFIGSLDQYDLRTGESGTDWYRKYSLGSDQITGDTYPINAGRYSGVGEVGRMVDRLRAFSNDTKPTGAFVESGDFDPTNGTRPPTPAEFRAEVWDAIIHGARAIHYFPEQVGGSFQWDVTPANVVQEMTTQNATITRLATVLQGPINPAGLGAQVAAPLEAAWRVAASGRYVFVLNLSNTTRTAQAITLSGAGTATTASVYGEGRAVSITSGRITDDFGPYALHIYQLTP